MKELTKEYLNEIDSEYKDNRIYKLSRLALNKTKISDLVRIGEEKSHLGNNFSIDIKTMKVANQKNSGRCWIFAGLNILREEVAKRYDIEDFELSQNYIAFYDKLEKINTAYNELFKEKNLSYILKLFNFNTIKFIFFIYCFNTSILINFILIRKCICLSFNIITSYFL